MHELAFEIRHERKRRPGGEARKKAGREGRAGGNIARESHPDDYTGSSQAFSSISSDIVLLERPSLVNINIVFSY
jgi:hypothetical protein